MKKRISLSIIFFTLIVSLFATPKLATKTKVNDRNYTPYCYLSDSGDAYYEIIKEYYSYIDEYNKSITVCELTFSKYFTSTDSVISLNISFSSKEKLDKFADSINLLDIENEFRRIRKQLIVDNAEILSGGTNDCYANDYYIDY